MISEVDIRDWERNISHAREAVDFGVDLDAQATFLHSFIDKVEALVVVQLQPKQVAALFKEKK